MSHIEIETNEATKCVEVWLTRVEAEDATIKSRLEAIFGACNKEKYTAAVFYSGKEDLLPLTAQLLLSNRVRLADKTARGEDI